MRERSFEVAMKSWLLGCLLCFVFLVPGCRSAPKTSPDMSYLAGANGVSSSTQPWMTLTFVDKPELQDGTGPMDAGAPPEFTGTKSGLRYRILRASDGKKPTAASTVTVNYRGWLNNGKVFDSSYERGKPASFGLSNVIDGWTEGMQLVGEGGMIELWVPSKLGYGEAGSPGSIPAHSNLHFIVELVNVD